MNEQLAEQVAALLNEPQIGLIKRMCETLGDERVKDLTEQALSIDAAGGMMTLDSSRRRTPGGVLVQLVRGTATPEEKRQMFSRKSKRSNNE